MTDERLKNIFDNWLRLIAMTKNHDPQRVQKIVRETAGNPIERNMRLHEYLMICEEADAVAWEQSDRSRHPELYA